MVDRLIEKMFFPSHLTTTHIHTHTHSLSISLSLS